MSMLGKHFTQESRIKLSLALKGHPVSEETRAKIRQSNMGHIVSAETRLKIGKGGIGKHSLRRYPIGESKYKRYRQRHKEERNACSREWRRNHPEYFEAYNQEHKDKQKLYFKKYQEENKEEARLRSANHYQKNRERILVQHSHWALAHRQNKAALHHKRKATILGLPPELNTLTASDIAETLATNKCFYCAAIGKMTLDHFIPVARGGSNTRENVVASCPTCQSRKHTKPPRLFMEELIKEEMTRHRLASARAILALEMTGKKLLAS